MLKGKVERRLQRAKERMAAEERTWTEANERRHRERAERFARARAAWDEAGGGEQTRMLLMGCRVCLHRRFAGRGAGCSCNGAACSADGMAKSWNSPCSRRREWRSSGSALR